MSDQQDTHEEIIPIEGDEPQPVPVPSPTPKPVSPPVPKKPKKKEEDFEPIALEDFDEQTVVEKRIGGGKDKSLMHKVEFKRPVNLDGHGATRCRIWRSKIAEDSLLNMETLINEWLDENDIEIKHVNQTIGMMEGKRSEPNLIVIVWY